VRDLARGLQLVRDLGRDFRGNGERQAHVAAGTAVDLRVDADDLSGGVPQRAPRVYGIDRRGGLEIVPLAA